MDIGLDFELASSLNCSTSGFSNCMSQKQIWKDQVAKADLCLKVDPNKNQRADWYFSALHVSFITEM